MTIDKKILLIGKFCDLWTDKKNEILDITMDEEDDDEPSKISLDEHALNMNQLFVNSSLGYSFVSYLYMI